MPLTPSKEWTDAELREWVGKMAAEGSFPSWKALNRLLLEHQELKDAATNPFRKRDLVFVQDKGVLAVVLGLSPERCAVIEQTMNEARENKRTLRQVIELMNDRGDLTDAEWTVLMYTLGWYQAGGE